jgi:hypothetical protein
MHLTINKRARIKKAHVRGAFHAGPRSTSQMQGYNMICATWGDSEEHMSVLARCDGL